ncbi:MAG: ABC transporter permease, partial [Ignavibacteriae bacterium]|nr:ABC transporter permease [Ignavibacteriota bacterium]
MKTGLPVIVEIVKKEFHQISRDKRMLAVSFMAPLLQVLLLGYAATTDIKDTTVVVCDMDKTAVSRDYVKRFTTSQYFIQKYSVDVPEAVNGYIEQGKATVALVVPRGFGNKVLSNESVQVQIIMDGTDANTANILLGYANLINGQYSQSILASYVRQGMRTGRVLPEPRVWFNPDLLSSNFMVPGVVALVLMIITMTLTSL